MVLREDLIKLLKFHLSIGQTTDPTMNSITDEELEAIMVQKSSQLGYSYPHIPKDQEGLVLCLVRKEIYWKMATISAPLYKLNLDGLAVSKEVRFDHYMKLIQEVEKEYQAIKNDPNRVTIQQTDLLVKRNYNLSKYYNNYVIPTINLNVDKINESSIDISIDYGNTIMTDVYKTNIYYCTEPIVDKYDDYKINDKAKCITLKNTKQKYLRVTTDTKAPCYLVMEVSLVNSLKAYSEEKEVVFNE